MNYDFNNGVGDGGVSVHAGFPNPAADKRLTGLDLNQLLIRYPSSTFLFRIRGEQGNSFGIFDSDIAIVDRSQTPQAGSLVLWHDGQKFNLSAIKHIAEGSTVWGIVTAIIHQYQKANK